MSLVVDSTVQDLDDLIKASQNVKRPYEGNVYLNLAFYTGKQWTAWDGTRVFEPVIEDYREKVVDNRIQPFVRTEIAKMTKSRPIWVGVPNSQSDDDVGAARYAEMALDDAWKRHNMRRKLRAALLWSRLAGCGFWKVTWDSTVGNSRDVMIYGEGHEQQGTTVKDPYGKPVDPQQFAQLPADALQSMQEKTIHQGDVSIELRTFFEVFPDPHCGEEGLEDAEWVAEEAVYTREHMAKHFPDHALDLNYDVSPTSGIAMSRMPLGSVAGVGMPDEAKGIKVRELWTQTRHVVWVENGQVLKDESNPYGWLPYVMFTGTPVPGQFWPDCTVNQMRPRQVDLNKYLSQVSENADRIGNPPLMMPSSMDPDVQFHGLPGEQVVYQDTGSPNALPSWLQAPNLPPYISENIDRAEKSLMEISGQHEVSAAQVPAGVTAASALSLLQEQDDTRLGPDTSDMENALTESGRRVIELIHKFYTDERHLRVTGEDGVWDIEAFKGSMLDGCNGVEVQEGSSMPQSKATKQAAIERVLQLMLQSGVSINERNFRRALSQMEVGGVEQFFATQTRVERQVNEENRKLALGMPFEINSFDNDEYHIAGHTDAMMSAKYQRLAPQIKQLWEMHLQAHYSRQAAIQMAQMEGMPPPPGTGPPGQPMVTPGPPPNGSGPASQVPSPKPS